MNHNPYRVRILSFCLSLPILEALEHTPPPGREETTLLAVVISSWQDDTFLNSFCFHILYIFTVGTYYTEKIYVCVLFRNTFSFVHFMLILSPRMAPKHAAFFSILLKGRKLPEMRVKWMN